jgi:hypothetical protein
MDHHDGLDNIGVPFNGVWLPLSQTQEFFQASSWHQIGPKHYHTNVCVSPTMRQVPLQ